MTKSLSAIAWITAIASLPLITYASSGDELIKSGFRAAVCNIDSMTVSFRMDEAFGEPLVTSKMRWTAGPNTTNDCLSRLTHIWIQARTDDDTLRFIRISPEIVAAGTEFGPTATESPNWSSLFCHEPVDTGNCESISEAKSLFNSHLRFESFEVVSVARSLSSLSSGSNSNSNSARNADPSTTKLDNDAFSLDSLLADAVNDAIAPATSNPAEPVLTPEQIEEQHKKQKEEQARDAVNNVVTLIASSLAQVSSPSHKCESSRVVANWVQARGTCQLNFRSEANHEFLCSEDGEPQPVRATRRANINLETDLQRVAPIRVSDEGWASVVLELSDELRTTTEGSYKTNRWQFTADSERVEDLKRLASSLLTLKDYCEGG